MRRTVPWILIAAMFAVLGIVSVGSASPASAATVLPAPTGITATRTAANPMNFTVAWKAVSGVDHYNVSVFYAGADHVTIVPGAKTSLAVTGVDYATQYRITVSTRAKDGTGTTSGYIWLNPAVPGAPTALTAIRDTATNTTLKLAWVAPKAQGYTPITGYQVTTTRMVDNVVVSDQTMSATTLGAAVGDLDPLRNYSVKVTAVNKWGSSPVATVLVGSNLPNAPTGIVAARDKVDPAIVHATWVAPTYVGSTPIERYEVVTVDNGVINMAPVDAKTFAFDTKIANTSAGFVAVRACNAQGCSYLGTKANITAALTEIPVGVKTSTNPFIAISENSGTVTFETTGIIGTTALYPRLFVQVKPTLANGGFTDMQWGQNGASTMTFQTVPTGTYWAFVFGVKPDGTQDELARKLLVIGGDGTMTEAEWQVVMGNAVIKANRVDMPYTGENRVLSVRTRKSTDMAMTTTATLQSGWGYGVWFRTSLDASGISGFSFQYDPMWGNQFIIRHWYQGRECSSPIANTPFPARMVVNAAHRITVVAQGDTMWAAVDGMEVFRVPSLSEAVAKSQCKYPMPMGTRIGFRTWATSAATFVGTFFDTTLSRDD